MDFLTSPLKGKKISKGSEIIDHLFDDGCCRVDKNQIHCEIMVDIVC